jgi:hypothetical protein
MKQRPIEANFQNERNTLPSLRIIVLCVLCAVTSARAQKHDTKYDTNFPTDDEIRLVLTQAERAVGEYKPLLDMEEKMLGKAGAEAVAKDRETVRGIDVAIVAFGKNPQAFNGPLGFAFFEWLDDACRNALLSSVSATNNATVGIMDGDKEKAQTNIELAKDLANVSTVLYTVSENAGALYTRYVDGEDKLAQVGLKAATDCVDILKKGKKAASKP